jgi:[acyl-carrier-protein] S-malonyltransferase
MIVFTFPGQGSQRPGMGEPWRDHPSWELVREASDIAGRDVARLLLDADADELTATRNSQLATFVLSLVVLDAVERLGVSPARAAGHSLGEYTALVAAGALGFDDGIRLVAERGDAMQAAAEEHRGAMAAILGLGDDQVELACVATEGEVWVANFNAPGQVVIAGEPDAVQRAGEAAKRLGAKRSMSLPVSGAFHTPHMAPARERLEKAIDAADLRAPDVPVMANVDAAAHLDATDWAALLRDQLTSPVRWRQILYELDDAGVSTFLELGPGSVLTGMAKRTVKGAHTLSVAEPADLDDILEALAQPSATARGDEGEGLAIRERLLVSPAAGIFTPSPDLVVGRGVAAGDLVGHVGGTEFRSPFSGTLMGVLAVPTERVMTSQPLAWLQASDPPEPTT